jgi:hypothetical protein
VLQLLVFLSEFVFARMAQMVCKKDTEVYFGSSGMSLELLVFLHWFAGGVTNEREREWAPKSLVPKCCVVA